MTNMVARPVIVVIGWVGMFIGLAIPAVASLEAMRLFWSWPCRGGEIRWSAVPLLVGCEPLSEVRLVVGWTATVAYITALAIAAAASALSAAIFARSQDKRRAVSFLLLPLATCAVAGAVILVIISDPDRRANAIGAWISQTAFAALGTYIAVLMISSVVRVLALRLTGHRKARDSPVAGKPQSF